MQIWFTSKEQIVIKLHLHLFGNRVSLVTLLTLFPQILVCNNIQQKGVERDTCNLLIKMKYLAWSAVCLKFEFCQREFDMETADPLKSFKIWHLCL